MVKRLMWQGLLTGVSALVAIARQPRRCDRVAALFDEEPPE